MLLHRGQTDSDVQVWLAWSRTGAPSIWRVGSSRQDVSFSRCSGSIKASRGQQRDTMWARGSGGLWVRSLVSMGVSGIGHSKLAACRAWSKACCTSCVGLPAGWVCRPLDFVIETGVSYCSTPHFFFPPRFFFAISLGELFYWAASRHSDCFYTDTTSSTSRIRRTTLQSH